MFTLNEILKKATLESVGMELTFKVVDTGLLYSLPVVMFDVNELVELGVAKRISPIDACTTNRYAVDVDVDKSVAFSGLTLVHYNNRTPILFEGEDVIQRLSVGQRNLIENKRLLTQWLNDELTLKTSREVGVDDYKMSNGLVITSYPNGGYRTIASDGEVTWFNNEPLFLAWLTRYF